MTDQEIPLRITLIDPLVGGTFALQSGRTNLRQTTRSTGAAISFEFTVRARGAGNSFSLLGPFCQGPRTSRFVYVNSGTYAGDRGSRWSRRAKVPLAGITR